MAEAKATKETRELAALRREVAVWRKRFPKLTAAVQKAAKTKTK